MGMYQIKEIEHLSGIKAHTLRIWEKRYNIVDPHRTDTNIRYYNDNDLKRILNISILNKNGYKISKIADFTDDKLNNELLTLTTDSENMDAQIGTLIKAMIDFDKQVFDKIFLQSLKHKGFQETILQLIYPFFKRVGILWLSENIDPAQEHFISNMVRQKIIVAIDGLPEFKNDNSENFVLFLPEGQWHEIGLLMSSYLIKKNGHNSLYLGSSLPTESVENIKDLLSFNYIITTLSLSKSGEDIHQEILSLAAKFPDKTIFIGGNRNETSHEHLPQNIIMMESLDEFNDYLIQLKKN
jgi:DNA-binding transcriptional MerR regulator